MDLNTFINQDFRYKNQTKSTYYVLLTLTLCLTEYPYFVYHSDTDEIEEVTREGYSLKLFIGYLLILFDFLFMINRLSFVKQKQTKHFADFQKIFVNFQNFQNYNFVKGKFLKIQSSINIAWGQARSQQKIWTQSVPAVLTFIECKQRSRQAKYIHLSVSCFI